MVEQVAFADDTAGGAEQGAPRAVVSHDVIGENHFGGPGQVLDAVFSGFRYLRRQSIGKGDFDLPHRQQWSDGYQKTIPKALALSLFRDCQAMGVHLICMEGTKHGFASQPMPDSPYTPSNDLLPLPLDATSLPEDPIAVMIFAPEEAHPSLVAMIHERYGAAVSVRTWGGIVPCLEVIAPSTNKAVGVTHLANLYQIPKQRIIAFGDEDNDYDMLHEAGHGVAMRNAIDTIKAVADDVTTFDHHQDGVAHYLCNYFGVS